MIVSEQRMKRAIGYGCFWAAGGFVIDMMLNNLFVQILCAVLCVLIGYRLYFCK